MINAKYKLSRMLGVEYVSPQIVKQTCLQCTNAFFEYVENPLENCKSCGAKMGMPSLEKEEEIYLDDLMGEEQ